MTLTVESVFEDDERCGPVIEKVFSDSRDDYLLDVDEFPRDHPPLQDKAGNEVDLVRLLQVIVDESCSLATDAHPEQLAALRVGVDFATTRLLALVQALQSDGAALVEWGLRAGADADEVLRQLQTSQFKELLTRRAWFAQAEEARVLATERARGEDDEEVEGPLSDVLAGWARRARAP